MTTVEIFEVVRKCVPYKTEVFLLENTHNIIVVYTHTLEIPHDRIGRIIF